MNKIIQWTIGVTVLVLGVILLATMGRGVREVAPQTAMSPLSQSATPAEPEAATPTPTAEFPPTATPAILREYVNDDGYTVSVYLDPQGNEVHTWTNDEGGIVSEINMHFPTLTPIPTRTPTLTPTRQPGPTETPYPLPQPARDPEGFIQYAVLRDQTEADDLGTTPDYLLQVDSAGAVVGAPAPIEMPRELQETHNTAPRIYRDATHVAISPDRKTYLYMLPCEPGVRIEIFNHSTQKLRQLAESLPFGADCGGRFLGWHPDGRRFLYWAMDFGLWWIDSTTLDVTYLASTGIEALQGAAISPNGQTVAYIVAGPGMMDGTALWTVSVAGGDSQILYADIGYGVLHTGSWSPDNQYLLYLGVCTDQPLPPKERIRLGLPPEDIFCLVNVAERARTTVSGSYTYWNTTWSPDGRYLAATGVTPDAELCNDAGPFLDQAQECLYRGQSIYLIDIETRTARPLTTGIAPAWAPDGSRLAFLSNRSGAPEVWTVTVDGSDLRQLTNDMKPKNPWYLSWLPEVK